MLDFLMNNWGMAIVAVAAVAVIGYSIYVFANMPTNDQLLKVKEWLLYAVCKAEKEFGSNTGAIKLRYVYDAFLSKFPGLAKIVTFDIFSKLVDDVLVKFRTMLQTNTQLQEYVNEAVEVQEGEDE